MGSMDYGVMVPSLRRSLVINPAMSLHLKTVGNLFQKRNSCKSEISLNRLGHMVIMSLDVSLACIEKSSLQARS